MALVAVVLIGAGTIRMLAQAMPESALKAEFLFAFAKYTEWPEDVLTPTAPIVLCVVDAEVGTALEAVVTGRLLNQHPVIVSRVKLDDSLRPCVILYAGKLDKRRTVQMTTALGTASVLTVGDAEAFAESGGMIGFFEADGHMKFAINLEAVERRRIRLSAQLLKIAKIVKG
jgi:YfiR/HmsC-like